MRQVLGCQFTSARYKQLCCRRHRHAIGAVTYRHSFSDCYKISGKTGLLEYLQLLSGPDQVHRPYNTSYPTYIIAAPSQTVLLGPQRLVISCLSFRCANPLAKIYYATFLWSNRRYSKLFRVSGFEPDPTSIVSPSSFGALPLGAFLRQAALLILFNRAPISPT